MGVRLGTGLLLLTGLLAGPAGASAQATDQPASSVSITAPQQVAAGESFSVKTTTTISGPDRAFLAGGFMDYQGSNPVPTRRKCPATPAGTFAGDTPQIPQPPGLVESTTRARNKVVRTGMLRYCAWVINETTGAVDATGAAYIKAIAAKKKRPSSARRVRAAAVATLRASYKGHTSQVRNPITLRVAKGMVRDLVYTASFRCSDGIAVTWGTRVAPFAFGQGGTFSAVPTPFFTQNDAVRIQGRVGSRNVTGSFSEEYTSVLGNTCQSGKVRFTASRPRPRR